MNPRHRRVRIRCALLGHHWRAIGIYDTQGVVWLCGRCDLIHVGTT